MAVNGKFCVFEPALGKFVSCIGHVFAAEYTQSKHLFGCQLWIELGIKVATCPFCKLIAISLLHFVIDCNGPLSHLVPSLQNKVIRRIILLMGQIKYALRSRYWRASPTTADGTNRANGAGPMMSVVRDRLEVAGREPKRRF